MSHHGEKEESALYEERSKERKKPWPSDPPTLLPSPLFVVLPDCFASNTGITDYGYRPHLFNQPVSFIIVLVSYLGSTW